MLSHARLPVGGKVALFPCRRLYSFKSGRFDPYNAMTATFDDAKGGEGSLSGWSVSIKENIAMEGVPTTCCSKMLESTSQITDTDYRSPFDATVVRQLRRHGARITSRNNCDEFAMGGLNKHSIFGPVANPAPYQNVCKPNFDTYPPRAPGGSSGGAAAAVRANLCRVYVLCTH